MSGEVQTRVHWPQGVPGIVETYAGQFAWEWTANFEAYEAFPARLGSTPLGTYRFVVDGCINDAMDMVRCNAGSVCSEAIARPDRASPSGIESVRCVGGRSAAQLRQRLPLYPGRRRPPLL